MAEELNESPSKDWKQIPGLQGSKIESLFNDLKELEEELEQATADYRERIAATRALIEDLIRPLELKHTVRVLGRICWWTPAKTGERLDAKKLALVTGATPDQLKQAQVPDNKKGFLTIRSAKDSEIPSDAAPEEKTVAA